MALGVNTTDIAGDAGASLDSFSARVGRRPTVAMWYQSWSEPLFYWSQMPVVDARGGIPMVTWEPVTSNGKGVPLESIAAGQHDAYLVTAARAAREWGRPFFVRFAHEMNGSWYPWGRGVHGNTSHQYIAAWRHVVGVFRREGAANVRWVWSPNATSPWVPRFESLYPGDSWVDWVALDGYNWGPLKGSGWRSFARVFAPSYEAMAVLTRKPIMIGETGAPERGGNKARWIRQALLRDLPRRMPNVRALVWFDRLKETDWRVNSSPGTLAAFRNAAVSRSMSLSAAGLLAVQPRSKLAPRTALRRPRIHAGWRSLGLQVRLRGSRCFSCAATVTLKRGNATARIRMRRRGRRFRASLTHLRRGPLRFRISLRDGANHRLAASRVRRLYIR